MVLVVISAGMYERSIVRIYLAELAICQSQRHAGLAVVVSDISRYERWDRRVRMLRIAAWARMVLVVSCLVMYE